MELDDLKATWNQDLAKEPLRFDPGRKARSGLRRFRVLLAFEVATALFTGWVAGAFLATNGARPRFAVAGGVLALAAVAGLASGLRQVSLLRGVDLSGPVVLQQERLERLQILRIRHFRAAMMVGLTCWVAVPVVAAQGLLGLDLVEAFGARWILANVGFGLVLVPLVAWLLSGRSLARLREHLSDRSLTVARSALEDLRRLESDA